MTRKVPFDQKFIPEPNTGCWLWTSAWDRDGYGRCTGYKIASREAYKLYVGPIHDGMCVCHKCDVRCCVNPDHLFLGTNEENTMDRQNKGRSATGSKNGWSILTEEDVARILSDNRSCVEIAKSFNVTPSNISHIRKGKAWKHVKRVAHG